MQIPEVASDSDKKVREAILMLLASEGSLKSQMVIQLGY